MLLWINKGNPSSSYASGQASKQKIIELKEYLAELCDIKTLDYNIIINSGASEGNAHILTSVATSFLQNKRKNNFTPHFIVSEIEHKSILLCVQSLVELNLITVSYIKPNLFGFIEPESVKALITP